MLGEIIICTYQSSNTDFQYLYRMVLENLAYVAIGFVTTFMALEAAWHFTACKIKDKTLKPCLYKQLGLVS
jgi:hypothetical protein